MLERYFSPKSTEAVTPVKSFCLYLDVDETITFSDLTGVDIESSEGTAVLAKAGNTIKATSAGTVWSLILDNGAELPLQGSLYDISSEEFHGVSTTGDMFYRQDTYHYNLNNGFDLYTKDGETGEEIEHKLHVPYVAGSPVVASVSGYALQKSCPVQRYKGVIIPNGSETGFRFPAGSVMDKSNSMNIVLNVPANFTKLELDKDFIVSGVTENIEDDEIICIDASTDALTWINIGEADGSGDVFSFFVRFLSENFNVNDTIYLRARYNDDTISNTKTISTIATVTMDTPELTAGTEGTITGTSNGSVVDVYSRVSSPEGAWELFDGTVAVDETGNWTATGTIADADTYDFIARDSVDPDGNIQIDDVVVASASTAKLTMNCTCTASTPMMGTTSTVKLTMNCTCTASTPTSI